MREARSLALSLLAFAALLVAVWLTLWWIWRALPHVRPGHNQIYALKQQVIADGEVFPADAPVKLVIFGNSRVQAGFIPDLFDSLSGGVISSYNLGLPNSSEFIREIVTLTRRGQTPTHILLTEPWSGQPLRSFWDNLGRDRWLIEQLFPFRKLPRDLLQFWVRSRSFGGLSPYYERMKGFVGQARLDRGYFFIENQSHYPGHRLPEDFRIETDTPHISWKRQVDHRGPIFEQLVDLAQRERIRLLMVPTYFREGMYAAATSNEEDRAALAPHGIEIVGPDYWLYPNELFSDATHLNREGAALHTRGLFELVGSLLVQEEETAALR